MGELVSTTVDLEIEVAASSGNGERAPGHGWTLSAETLTALREIDDNIRAAEQMSGTLVVG